MSKEANQHTNFPPQKMNLSASSRRGCTRKMDVGALVGRIKRRRLSIVSKWMDGVVQRGDTIRKLANTQ